MALTHELILSHILATKGILIGSFFGSFEQQLIVLDIFGVKCPHHIDHVVQYEIS